MKTFGAEQFCKIVECVATIEALYKFRNAVMNRQCRLAPQDLARSVQLADRLQKAIDEEIEETEVMLGK